VVPKWTPSDPRCPRGTSEATCRACTASADPAACLVCTARAKRRWDYGRTWCAAAANHTDAAVKAHALTCLAPGGKPQKGACKACMGLVDGSPHDLVPCMECVARSTPPGALAPNEAGLLCQRCDDPASQVNVSACQRCMRAFGSQQGAGP
jgi:hypothetical protein